MRTTCPRACNLCADQIAQAQRGALAAPPTLTRTPAVEPLALEPLEPP